MAEPGLPSPRIIRLLIDLIDRELACRTPPDPPRPGSGSTADASGPSTLDWCRRLTTDPAEVRHLAPGLLRDLRACLASWHKPIHPDRSRALWCAAALAIGREAHRDLQRFGRYSRRDRAAISGIMAGLGFDDPTPEQIDGMVSRCQGQQRAA